MLATSLIVVRKMLDAVAGSAPSLLSVSGISAPAIPLMVQASTMETSTTSPNRTGSVSPYSSA